MFLSWYFCLKILPFETDVGVALRCLNRRGRLRFVLLGPPSTLDTDSTHTQTIVTIRSTYRNCLSMSIQFLVCLDYIIMISELVACIELFNKTINSMLDGHKCLLCFPKIPFVKHSNETLSLSFFLFTFIFPFFALFTTIFIHSHIFTIEKQMDNKKNSFSIALYFSSDLKYGQSEKHELFRISSSMYV